MEHAANWGYRLVQISRGLRRLMRRQMRQATPLTLIHLHDMATRVSAVRERDKLAAAGYTKGCFSTHSLRRGVSSLAFGKKLQKEMIKLLGYWASDAYKQYIDIALDKRVQTVVKFLL